MYWMKSNDGDTASGDVIAFTYAYDAVGNRTAMTETTSLAETTVTTYTYDAANRLLVSPAPGHLVTNPPRLANDTGPS